MSDLDDLAAAADFAPRVNSRAPTPRKRVRLIPIVFLLAAAIVVGIVIVSNSTVLHSPPADAIVDPGFSVVRGSGTPLGTFASAAWWNVENTSPSPLVVSDVRLNDEYACPVCYLYPNNVAVPDADKKCPVTLTIGETGYFSEFLHDVSASSGYAKDVIFVDISTNRGKFRYRPFKGFERIK
jgi:hypothetical protein